MKLNSFILLLWVFSFQVMAQSKVPSHTTFDELLKKHVTADGKVNYKGFIKDASAFNGYLGLLSKSHPDKTWSREEQMAFWINAYNAFTIKLIVDNYPLKSIKDIGGKIYKVNTPWDIPFIKIGEETYTLNKIEHERLREDFDDPRIHFAIVCASKSCPKLLDEAFIATKLDQQLTRVGKEFLRDPSRNKITTNALQLSEIFNWYKGDFTKQGTLIEFLNRFSSIKINSNASVNYLEYDWSLNE